jgi:hypothetical protein
MDYLSPQDKPHFLGFIFKRLEMVEVTNICIHHSISLFLFFY